MNKIRIAKAVVNGNESLILITLNPDGRKMCMTMAELDDDGMTEVIVADDGSITSKDEVGYEDSEELYESEWGEISLCCQLVVKTYAVHMYCSSKDL